MPAPSRVAREVSQLLDGLMNGARVPLDEVRRHPHGGIFDDTEIRVEVGDSVDAHQVVAVLEE